MLFFFDEQMLEDGKEKLYQTKGNYVESWSDEESEEEEVPTKSTMKGKGKGKGKGAGKKKGSSSTKKKALVPPKIA